MHEDTRGFEPGRLAWRGGAMLFDRQRVAAPAPALLDPASYGQAAVQVGEGGRSAAWFVHGDAGAAVLRRYRRGGLTAKLGRRDYLWLGEARTRSFAEFRLLHAMWREGLPVPRPLAAAYWRRGIFYAGAILVERIAGARALAQVMDDGASCQAAAQAIARMHRAGVWHADLNAYNVLLDPAGAAWLIDFDRGRRLARLSDAAREANLRRLRRSMAKLAGERGDRAWQVLAQAYRSVWDAGVVG